MAIMAEFESVPQGTQRRSSSEGQWVSASIGDLLSENGESRNIHSTSYQVRIYTEAMAVFPEVTAVNLNNLTGDVRGNFTGEDWESISTEGQYGVKAIGTGPGGSVSILCGTQTTYRPPPWKNIE